MRLFQGVYLSLKLDYVLLCHRYHIIFWNALKNHCAHLMLRHLSLEISHYSVWCQVMDILAKQASIVKLFYWKTFLEPYLEFYFFLLNFRTCFDLSWFLIMTSPGGLCHFGVVRDRKNDCHHTSWHHQSIFQSYLTSNCIILSSIFFFIQHSSEAV